MFVQFIRTRYLSAVYNQSLAVSSARCFLSYCCNFLLIFSEFISQLLVPVLEDEILALQIKTELELKLTGLPLSIWDEVLQRKMQFTTHMFSLQSSGLSNFTDPESRWAYSAVYTPVHASIIYDIVLQGKFTPLLNLIASVGQSPSEQ